MKYVEVIQISGRTATVELANDATVADAISQAGFDTNGYKVSVSGHPDAGMSHVVENNGRIILAREVKGAKG